MTLRLRSSMRGTRKRSGSPSGSHAVPNDDDLSEGLPPTDGALDDEDPEDAAGTPALATDDLEGMNEVGDEHEQESDLLDDKALGDAAVTDEGDGREPERGWLDDSDEAAGLDVGEDEVELGDESTASLDDATEPDGDDDDPSLDPGELGSDGGEEGIEGEEHELREEDLPALDADDDGEVDEKSLYEAPESVMELDPAIPWDDRAWGFEPFDPAPATAFAAGEDALFACAGASLVRVFPGPVVRTKLPEAALRGAIDARGAAWLVGASGALFRLERRASEAERIATAPGALLDVASAGGSTWVLDARGVVSVSHDAGASFRPVADDVIALAGSGERAVVLVADGKNVRELSFEAGTTRTSVLPFASAAAGAEVPWEILVRGNVSVVFAHGAGVHRRTGASGWERVASSADAFAVTILGRGSDEDALLLALSDMEEPTRLAYVPASGYREDDPAAAPRIVAELAPGEDTVGGETAGDEEVGLSLATFEGTVIVAGPFGTRKLALVPPRH